MDKINYYKFKILKVKECKFKDAWTFIYYYNIINDIWYNVAHICKLEIGF